MEEEATAIKNLTVADLKEFHQQFYGLGKSILVSIGNVDTKKVTQFIESEFADFEAPQSYKKLPNPHQPVKVINEDVITPDKQNAMTLGFHNIKISEEHPDFAALNVAASILGGGFLNSRIADRLRQKDGVSYGAGAGFQADGDASDQNSRMYLYAIYAPANYDKVQLALKKNWPVLSPRGLPRRSWPTR